MALTVVWERAAVPMPDGSERVLNRGEVLPAEVTDFQRSVMTMIGAVRDLGQSVAVVQQAVDEVEAGYQAPPPAPVLPAEVPPVVPVTPVVTEPAPPVVTDPGDDLDKPRPADNKDAWEQYAAARGYMTQSEAESMTKARLIEAVNARETV